MTHVSAFGLDFDLDSTANDFIRDDSIWRLKNIYEAALATQPLALTGVALDIGAGFGAFAVPFAAAFPGWRVICLEPDPACFAALQHNIARLGLTNVAALPFAVGIGVHDAPADPEAVRRALDDLSGEGVARLDALLPRRDHSRHRVHVGYMERGHNPHDDFAKMALPTIAARDLAALAPTLLKIVAPQIEASILYDLRDVALDHIIGETWDHVPDDLVYGDVAGKRHTWLPLAGPPLVSLRRSPDLAGREQRLDVVVAMYNSAPFIAECVAGILNGYGTDVRVLVVDDGSTDGGKDVVAQVYGADPRVKVLSKPNGGCASARNFGRLHSNASHIAFVDADDVPGRDLYAGLLDLARHTGAELVQGGFELLIDEGDGLRHEASYETHDVVVREAHRHNFGIRTCHLLKSDFLMKGQPTIWRRVYRRDFLDNRKIWFPEHIRAFDDQIFQILTLQAVANVPVLDGVYYGYRQHPAQDIRQGDERNFYSLEMFRLVLKRGLAEGWLEFETVLTSYVHTVNWISGKLGPDLRAPFVKGAAELWVYARKAFGDKVFADLPVSMFQAHDFAPQVAALEEKLRPFGQSYAFTYLDAFEMQVPLMKSLRTKA